MELSILQQKRAIDLTAGEPLPIMLKNYQK